MTLWPARLCLAAALASGCTAPEGVVAPKSPAALDGALTLVAEGPCAKLAAYDLDGDRAIVYGETGYELADWTPGERLAAAQSLVVVRGTRVGRSRRLLAGLPIDERGYAPGELRIERDSLGAPWATLGERRYAAHGKGVLFDERFDVFSLGPDGWHNASRASGSPIDLGGAKALPDVPEREACADGPAPGAPEAPDAGRLHFVPLAHARGADGAIFVAGRCQDESHIAYAETTLVVAVAGPGATQWTFGRPPRSSRLDGIVNLGLWAASAGDAWLVAYEPFVDPPGRHAFLSHWNGRAFREVDVGVDAGFMSVAGDSDGNVWLAAGTSLVRLPRGGAPERVPLPPPRWVEPAPEQHVTRVSVFDGREVWVETSYRVVDGGDRPYKRWGSALYSNRRIDGAPLYCDGAEPADRGLGQPEANSAGRASGASGARPRGTRK